MLSNDPKLFAKNIELHSEEQHQGEKKNNISVLNNYGFTLGQKEKNEESKCITC